MRRVVVATILTVGLLLGLATPRCALAEETSRGPAPASIVLGHRQISLDLPARAPLDDAMTDRARSPQRPFAPVRPHAVLSEDGMVVVAAAAVVGVLLLVIVVAGIAD
jgi:hypothetical protein